jgi:23S rRNA (guanosine2251-2'-O)-methyltransferase
MAIKFKGRKGGRDTPHGKSPQQRSAPGVRRNAPAGDERPPKRPFSPRKAAPERPPKPERGGGRQAERPGFRAEQSSRPPKREAGRQAERPGQDRGGGPERPRYEAKRPAYRDEPARRPFARQPNRPAERPARRAIAPPEPAKPTLQPAPAPRIRPVAPPRDGGLWLYGRHAVAAALANPERRIRRFLAATEMADDAKSLIVATGARLPLGPQPEILPRAAFETMVPAGAVHQGMALAVEPLAELAIEDVIDRISPPPAAGTVSQIVVLLDQVSDPHNVGAVLRSAAAFGALALVIPEHGAPPITGTLAKSASGALEHVPIIRVVNLARAIDRLKSAGFWCVGLDETAERPLAALKLEGRIALVLGGEGEGMRRLTRERCDLVARLPTGGAIASLNVSNAAAIALYELVRGEPTQS